ncbi:MAG: hypothetical protein ACI8Y4_000111 [Candidatus Poriferisodalaceae bacterium]|jgi:hypothetical protein
MRCWWRFLLVLRFQDRRVDSSRDSVLGLGQVNFFPRIDHDLLSRELLHCGPGERGPFSVEALEPKLFSVATRDRPSVLS